MWLLRGEFIRPPRDVRDLFLLNKSKLVHEQPITRQVNSAFFDATDHSGEGSFLLKCIYMKDFVVARFFDKEKYADSKTRPILNIY